MFSRKAIVLLLVVIVVIWVVSVNIFSKGSGNELKIEDSSFKKVTITTSNAAVKVLPTERKEASVSFTGEKKRGKKYTLQADVKGDTLRVKLKKKGWRLFDFNFSRQPKIVTVELPEKVYAQIQAKSDNGKIDIQNIEVDQLSLQTDNGAIDVQNVKASMTSAKTDNGRISLVGGEGEIEAVTDNGRISLETAHLHRSIDLKTDNGRIELQTDEIPTDAKIEAFTDNGRIDLFGQTNSSVTYGDGTYLIKLKTDNGGIRVTK